MADKYIWFEVEGEDEAILHLEIANELLRKRSKDFLEELSKDGMAFLYANVPDYTSYTQRHVDRSDVHWKPGGAGGGGEYESVVGVKRGTSDHPLYANRGTGVYGPFIKAPYHASNVTGKMWFYSEKYGRVIGVREVRGQRAQHFLYTTFRELQVWAEARLLSGIY
jgi:hypothetical protein